MKFCSVICTAQIPGIEHKLRTMRMYTLQCDRWPALCDSLESMDRRAQKQTNCPSVTHITWKIFNCIFFHRQRGPTRCALRVASHPSRRLYSTGAVRERMATLRTDAPPRRDQLPITLAEQ